MTSTGKGSQLHGLRFCKLIDKSTPLFTNAINNNEQLYMEFYFYRINRFGKWEKYYYIQLRGAFYQIFSVSSVKIVYLRKPLTSAMNISYANISLLTPNSVIWRCPKITTTCLSPAQKSTDSGLKTLNSKAVGRLLAAGGIYNGNIEGFRDTAEKLGGDAPAGYKQVLNEKQLDWVLLLHLSFFKKRI